MIVLRFEIRPLSLEIIQSGQCLLEATTGRTSRIRVHIIQINRKLSDSSDKP